LRSILTRAAAAAKSKLEAERLQIEQAKLLEAAESWAAQAAVQAAKLDERDKALTQQRVDAQARATEAAQRRQQAEQRRADAAHRKLEAEQALAATIAARVRIERDAAESRQKRLADSAQRNHLRNERYGLVVATAWHAARGTTGVLLIVAIALGIGVSALMTESRPPKESTALPSQPVERAAAIERASIPFFKTDKDLDAFALRVQQTPGPRDKSPQ